MRNRHKPLCGNRQLCGNRHSEIVVALVEAGADVNQCIETNGNTDGNTLLHVASQRGDAEMVSTLMMCNASLTVKNNQGLLPIDVARNDEIRQLINDEMTARFDHGLKRAVIPPPPPAVDSEAAAAAIAEVEQDVGGSAGTVSAHATATSVASEDEESEESSDEEDDGW